MLIDTTNKVLGTKIDPELKEKIKRRIMLEEEVENVFNLVIHNYGEGFHVGSVDIEVRGDMTAKQIDLLSHRIVRRVKEEGVHLTSVGITGGSLNDPTAAEIWDNILSMSKNFQTIGRLYGYCFDAEEKCISFYVLPVSSKKHINQELNLFRQQIEETYPEMKIEIDKVLAE